MELPFLTLDVFTTTRYEGNPLAVVRVPAPYRAELTQAQKQRIAAEFNLSETAFIHEHSSNDTHDQWVVDIFTTDQELPFAGHPTIGAASYLLHRSGLQKATLLLKAGDTPIANPLGTPLSALAEVAHNVHVHKARLADVITSSPSPGLGFSSIPEVAQAEAQAPLVAIVRGMNFLLVRLASVEQLSAVQTQLPKLDIEGISDPDWKEGFFGKYYYVLEDEGRATGDAIGVRTRMIEGALEDPATGSAASALCSYLALTEAKPDGESVRFEVTQGVEMGRKSVIGVEVGLKSGGKEIESVKLLGTSVVVMEGKLVV